MPVIKVKLNEDHRDYHQLKAWIDPFRDIKLTKEAGENESADIDTDEELLLGNTNINYYIDQGLKSRIIVQSDGDVYSPTESVIEIAGAMVDPASAALRMLEVDSTGADNVGQKVMNDSKPVVIASNQSTLPVEGAVTNTVLTTVLDVLLSALKTTLVDANDFVVASNKQSVTPTSGDNPIELVLSDNYISDVTINDGGTGYTAGSLVVDNTGTGGTGFAGTYTVNTGVIDSITITDGGSGYKELPTIDGDAGGSGADLEGVLTRDSRGIKYLNFSNEATNTATFYIGIDDTVTTNGEKISKGEELYNYPVDGLNSVWVYADIEDEDLEYTEVKRRSS